MGVYAALVSLAQTIDDILNNDQYYTISLHKKEQITSIREHLIGIKAFFQEFPEKSNDILEAQIRDIALEAEHRTTHFIQKQSELRYGLLKASASSRRADKRNKLSDTIKSIARGVKGIKNSVMIQKVRLGDDDSPAAASSTSRLAPSDDYWQELSDTINSITREVKDLCLGNDDSLPPPAPAAAASASSRLAPSHEKQVMIGFDDDLLAIKERLCGQSSKLQVIPIVGMGGIGKTTLALNAYNDRAITEHFHIRAWATLSQDYSVSKIISDLEIGESGQSNELNVYQSLKGRRYLIVIDDIWNKKAWDDVRRMFPDDNNGSRIMLTTRLSQVASYADSSSHLHEMHLMDTDRSWNLLREKVFSQQLCPQELVIIGEEIARSCEGLPLSIVVVAGLLSTVSKAPTLWEEIAKNVKSTIAINDEQFENIFSLSYRHLPQHLRACFLYMGAYPEDYDINVSKLIKLWVAEGFIKPSESKNLEEMAEEYLEDLVKRFLVLVSRKKCNGKIKSCRLHDVIRELCIKKAEQEKLLLYLMERSTLNKESTKNQRRISINQFDGLHCLGKIYGPTISTLICFVGGEDSILCLKYFRFLRVYALEYAYHGYILKEDQVCELFHLRYISWRTGLSFFLIPAAITNLQNLQTLIINKKWGYSKVCLPLEIWRMRQLRHLVCHQIDELPNPEEGATCGLENLQTLLEVGNFKCSESIMRMIPGIRKLGIVYYGGEEYQLDNLVYLQHLEKFKITVHGYDHFSSLKKNVNLVFPRTLKKLSLSGESEILPWDKDMMKIVGSLPNLQVLKVNYASKGWKQWETSEGEFPELKYLLIFHSYLEEWIGESSHFPSLIRLKLYSCYNLREIPDGIGKIPTLEIIDVCDCRKSLAESAKRIQEEQQSYGSDVLQVHCQYCDS